MASLLSKFQIVRHGVYLCPGFGLACFHCFCVSCGQPSLSLMICGLFFALSAFLMIALYFFVHTEQKSAHHSVNPAERIQVIQWETGVNQ